MVQIESVPGVFSSALGDIGYIFRSKNLAEMLEIVNYIHQTLGKTVCRFSLLPGPLFRL
jgi:hypothetical protein